jgi:glycosyltransferase involved in cell wall biosynthesis
VIARRDAERRSAAAAAAVRRPGRIKLAHVITELVVGGAVDNTLLSAAGMDRRRWEVHVVGGPGDWVDRARASSERVYVLPSLVRPIRPGTDARALLDLAALMRRERYDVVHTHSSKAGLLGRLAARLAGVEVVVHTIHGFPFNDQTLSPRVREALLWSERLAARVTDRLIAVAEPNVGEAERRGITAAGSIEVVHSGIDLRRFERLPDRDEARRRLGLPEDAPVVGTVGRLHDCNAPDVFVRAAHGVLAAWPEARVVIVGDGPLAEATRAATGGDRRFLMLGHREDVPSILPALDVFAFPILWGGLGRSLTEAMIVGLPVVASAVNGVPEIVEHERTGLLVPPGDVAALAGGMIRLLGDRALAGQLGRAARARVVPAFGADVMVEQLSALYERELAAARVGEAGD